VRAEIVALGEVLIDFIEVGRSPAGNPIFEANPGGAPGNVLATVAKLGRRAAFIGKVGRDAFGHQLRSALDACGIETSCLLEDAEAATTLAFVSHKAGGERDFTFLRQNSADTRLSPADLVTDLLENCRIFHFGTLSLTHEPARAATEAALALAWEAGAVVSFDPNLRPPLWRDLGEAKARMDWGCGRCHVLKIAQDELDFLSGTADAGVDWLVERYPNLRLILLTRGADGAEGWWEGYRATQPGFKVDTIDTTGAGDVFLGCCLDTVLRHGVRAASGERLTHMLAFAAAGAAIVTTRKGALLQTPSRVEIEALIIR